MSKNGLKRGLFRGGCYYFENCSIATYAGIRGKPASGKPKLLLIYKRKICTKSDIYTVLITTLPKRIVNDGARI